MRPKPNTNPDSGVKRYLDVNSVLWGTLFLGVAAFTGWIAAGLPLNPVVISTLAATFLIALGILGLILSRRTQTNSSPTKPGEHSPNGEPR